MLEFLFSKNFKLSLGGGVVSRSIVGFIIQVGV